MDWDGYALLGLLAIGVVIAAFTDLANRRIGNRLTLAIALGAPLFWWASGLSLWPGVPVQLGLALLAFLVGAVLFKLGQMGGGDVKLLAAIALWIAPSWFVWLILVAAVVNGVMTMAVVMRRARAIRAGRTPGKPQIPYGVPVAIATLAVLAVRFGPEAEGFFVTGSELL